MNKKTRLLSLALVLIMLLSVAPSSLAVFAAKTEVVPTVKESITSESYNFQDSRFTNGMLLTTAGSSVNPIRNSWTPNKGTNASTYIASGGNTYLNLSYDSAKHDFRYPADTSFNFTADVKGISRTYID